MMFLSSHRPISIGLKFVRVSITPLSVVGMTFSDYRSQKEFATVITEGKRKGPEDR